jgi:DnaD/phage-associated family protein
MTEGALSASDAALFGSVVYTFQANRGGVPLTQTEYVELHRLVELFGAEKVLKIMAEISAAGTPLLRVSQVSAFADMEDPLLQQIMALYAQEIEPHQRISPKGREILLALSKEFPDIELWREAIARAVKSNRRRLLTVEKILRQHQQTGSWDPPAKTRKREDGRTKEHQRRPASRETKYDEETLRRTREQESAGEWERPADLF